MYSDTTPFSIPWLCINGAAPFKNVNNCLNINVYSYLETSSGQSSNLYLYLIHFFNTSVKLDICGSLRQLFSSI